MCSLFYHNKLFLFIPFLFVVNSLLFLTDQDLKDVGTATTTTSNAGDPTFDVVSENATSSIITDTSEDKIDDDYNSETDGSSTSSSNNIESIVQRSDDDTSVLKSSIIETNDDNHNDNTAVDDSSASFDNQIFTIASSQNSGLANEITMIDQPVAVTLVDAATVELQQRAVIPSQNNNDNTESLSPIPQNITNQSDTPIKYNDDDNILLLDNNKSNTTYDDDDIERSDLLNNHQETTSSSSSSYDNLTEEIPSFSEWAQKRLEEAERNDVILNSSTQQQQQQQHNQQNNNNNNGSNNNKQGSGAKFRWKNYASIDCGAKIVASNPEAVSPSAILSPSRDEYKLNTCTSRIWFIVELCEAIQAKKIDFANFELFSSSPKDFVVSISDRFPSRDWSIVGQFQAKDERIVQSYDLHPQLFGKYIKIEVKSHYGAEHYCPISLFRVYGTSELEVLQKEDPVNGDRLLDDDDDDGDDDDDVTESLLDVADDDTNKNLFSSATDAVISLVKKAAQVLGTKGNYSDKIGNDDDDNMMNKSNDNKNYYTPCMMILNNNICTTPSHLIVCENCTDLLFNQIYELLSCKMQQIKNLLNIPLIKHHIIHTNNICNKFGLNFTNNNNNSTTSFNLMAFFPSKYLGAMCNFVAIDENKVVLNLTTINNSNNNSFLNNNETIIISGIDLIETSEPNIQISSITDHSALITEATNLVDRLTHTSIHSSKSDYLTATEDTTQIRPTKAFNLDEISLEIESNLHQQNTLLMTDDNNDDVEKATIEVDNTGSHHSSELFGGGKVPKTDNPPSIIIIDKVINEHLNEFDTSGPSVTTTMDSSETLDDHLEHFISEFNGGDHGGQQHSLNNNVPVTTPSTTPQAQKESVFLRLSNRIKALERNMSLSGQYLEELSKRYKKQVEDMQKLFEKTLSNLQDDNKKKDNQNKQLNERLIALTVAVDGLISDKKNWSTSTFLPTIITVLITIFVYNLISRRHSVRTSVPKENIIIEKKQSDLLQRRRQSIDCISPQHYSMIKTKRKRRPSDQALKIVRSALYDDDYERYKERKGRRIKKLSRVSMNRSDSISSPPPSSSIIDNNDWVEDVVNNYVEKIPFVLEESEHSSLEPLSTLNHIDKIVSITPPTFVKTATTSRLVRHSSQINNPVIINNNNKGKVLTTRKSVSVDESLKRSLSPIFVGSSSSSSVVNGTTTASLSSDEQHTPKKEKKSFKKIFKKVF